MSRAAAEWLPRKRDVWPYCRARRLNTGKGGSSITDSDLWAGNTIALNGPGKKNYHVISGSNGFIAL